MTPEEERRSAVGFGAKALFGASLVLACLGVAPRALPQTETNVALANDEWAPGEQKLLKAFREFDKAGRFDEALAAAKQLLVLREGVYGRDHEDTLATINDLAVFHFRKNDLSAAEPLFRRAIAGSERSLGREHPQTIASLNNLAALLCRRDEYAEAEALLRRVVQSLERGSGPEHPDTLRALNNLAGCLVFQRNYTSAEALYRRVCEARERLLGATHSDTLLSMGEWIQTLEQKGDYAGAAALCDSVHLDCAAKFGPEHSRTLTIAHNLGGLLVQAGEYARARSIFSRLAQIRGRTLGPEHPDTISSVNNLAFVLRAEGDYAGAEPLCRQALEATERRCGPDNPETLTLVDNLGLLLMAKGDFARAEELCRQAYEGRKKALGPNDEETLKSMNNLALVRSRMGDSSGGEGLYREALERLESTMGRNHPSTAAVAANLAAMRIRLGDLDEAEALLRRAVRALESSIGSRHTIALSASANLAMVLDRKGDARAAEVLYRKTMEDRGATLGLEHPDTLWSVNNLGWAYHRWGQENQARALVRDRWGGWRAHWSRLVGFASEREREIARRTFDPVSLPCALGMGQLAAETVSWFKGVALESVLAERKMGKAAREDPAVLQLVQQADLLKGRLREMLLRGQNQGAGGKEFTSMERNLEAIGRQLAQQVPWHGGLPGNFEITATDIRRALSPHLAMLEWVYFGELLAGGQAELRIAAIAIFALREPVIIDVGKADGIEGLIGEYRDLAGAGPKSGETHAARDTDLEMVSRKLYDRLVQPVEEVLGDEVKDVCISPDGMLHFVSFASLLDSEGRFWCQRRKIRYVSTGRDLLRKPSGGGGHEVMLMGNPDYRWAGPLEQVAKRDGRSPMADGRVAKTVAGSVTDAMANAIPIPKLVAQAEVNLNNNLRAGLSEEVRGMTLTPLPGTVAEVNGLSGRFASKGWTATRLMGGEATESALRGVKRPRILHVATHGFFLKDLEIGSKAGEPMGMRMIGQEEAEPRFIKDPMLRSGLALAGAQSTMNLWAAGKVPPPDQDGVLTAAETAELDLQGTWLVVLSACETGVGEAKSREGVFGLKRALQVAGAENLLMTLWRIDDEATLEIMGRFYDRVLNGEHPSDALAAVQTEALVRLRAESGLYHAVNRAAPFVLTCGTDFRAEKGQ